MNKRLQVFHRALGLTATQFADEIGVQRSSVSHVISGRNKPSMDFVEKILKRYPQLNVDWLILGSGAMFKGDDLFAGTGTGIGIEEKGSEGERPKGDSEGARDRLKDRGLADEVEVEPTQAKEPQGDTPNSPGAEGQKSLPYVKAESSHSHIPDGDRVVERVLLLHPDGTFTEFRRKTDQ